MVGGIYSPQPLGSRWPRLLAMGAPDSPVRHRIDIVRCPVRCHVSQPLGSGAGRPLETLSSCGIGQSGAYGVWISPGSTERVKDLTKGPWAQ
jgi:hypothetical protein